MKLSQLPVGALVKDPNTKYNNDVIIWQVLEHGHTGDPSGSTTLQSRDILTLKCFDAKEPNNINSDRKNYGNNRYKYSNILQWLNSDKNSWYEAQHTYDQAPTPKSNTANYNEYASEAGFLSFMSAQFRAALKTVSKTTVKNTVTDGGGSEAVSSKIFLLSTTEVGLANESSIAEGSVYSYYSSGGNNGRKKNLMNDAAKGDYTSATSPWYWWLRTPRASGSINVRDVSTDGTLGGSTAYSGYIGVAPAFCISSDTEVSDTPDASNVYTLQFAPSYVKAYIGDENGLAKLIWEQEHEIENKMSILYVGDSNNTSKKPKKSYVGYNGKAVQIMYSEPKIYGVAWDGSAATSFTRLEDAKNFSAPNPYYAGMSGTPSSPFDDLYPWCEMKKSEHTDAGTVVALPKFWYKLEYASGTTGLKVFIADKPVTGFKVSPAHMNRGDGAGERDVTYVGRYHCASDYKSKTGVMPAVSQKRSNARTSVHALGNNVWQRDFAMAFTTNSLYLVEYADWNSQAKIGYGNGASLGNMGYTDSMPYHTGTTQTSRTSYVLGTQYRYIEGLWDNCYDYIDGCYYTASGLNIILNPANFSDSANGILIGSVTDGFPSALTITDINGTFPMFRPTASNGSDSTYLCDAFSFGGSSSPCLFSGGAYDTGQRYGLFYVGSIAANSSYPGTGLRLMVLP